MHKPLPQKLYKSFKVGNTNEISRFAELINDFNPLHHNHEYAVNAGLKGIIAPGVMIGGFISSTIADWIPGVMVCGLGIKFPKPLYADSTVYVICFVGKQNTSKAKITFEVIVRGDVLAKGSCLLLLPKSMEAVQPAKQAA